MAVLIRGDRTHAIGVGFIACTKLLYTDPRARVKTGGIISESYVVGRGTRQGCPLSLLLFAIAIEPPSKLGKN